MANEPEARFHFSVWRPARIDRTYLHITGSGNGPERTALLDGSAVLEQLYAWDPGPHDFALSSSPAAVHADRTTVCSNRLASITHRMNDGYAGS